jgi:hypothetical protein
MTPRFFRITFVAEKGIGHELVGLVLFERGQNCSAADRGRKASPAFLLILYYRMSTVWRIRIVITPVSIR